MAPFARCLLTCLRRHVNFVANWFQPNYQAMMDMGEAFANSRVHQVPVTDSGQTSEARANRQIT
ncbi:hypothetical protein BDP81DRAFT_402430 [Colletotrichum phormii]|uniref:Uncharacterized protein n=1 Tax=Colletotrichum phormii TaxID=359342 RepID=A0AAJ0A0R7_9PEZI|nr:uncharacterized protein BDP81DRAFT_402430 [Colletotrichum phormii]KAK1654276.1 hypothetical protein BDP81DRAFT_402430 [Colletotrichum phormii]